MINKTILISTMLACLSLTLAAQEATNLPVRMIISRFSRPPMEKIEITDTNTINMIVALFPGYEKQPEDAFLRGHWPADYLVDLYSANGRKRVIHVVENKWTAGSDESTVLTTNWMSVLKQMTNLWSR
jgi:hypothetical protein